jgi:hypothetical protein
MRLPKPNTVMAIISASNVLCLGITLYFAAETHRLSLEARRLSREAIEINEQTERLNRERATLSSAPTTR